MVTLVAGTILVIVDLVIRVLAVVLIPKDRRPQTAAAWLLAIFFLPYIGILLFLLFGSRHLPKKRRRKQREINDFILETTQGIDRVSTDASWPSWFGPVVTLNRNLGSMPLVGGNSAEFFPDYVESIEAMTAEIESATRTVHVEFYLLLLDDTTAPFFDALESAHRRGVTVRVLLDHIGNSRYPGYRRTIRRLNEIGLQWHFMLPVMPFRGKFQRPDLRNHRKIVVVDGTVAFTGSQNVVDAGYQKKSNHRRGLQWKDLMVRFEGPIVAGIDALFVTDWYSETDELLLREAPAAERATPDGLDCQVVPSGPGFEGENNLRVFNALLYAARKRVVITSPYFVPDESMLYAITTAAQSGVEVQLFVSEIGDQPVTHHAQRSYYEALLDAGVRIFMYRAPTVLHAKHFSIDDEVAVFGSSNMDMRSFSLNLEISIVVRGDSFLRTLDALHDDYRANSRELTLEEWRARPWHSHVLDNVARLTASVQ